MSKILNVSCNKNMTLNCFVCDQKVSGEKVNLAASTSTHSKVTLPEKISQLIGDDYVVAVTEQDCVCKRCASLLNHMDKLENELYLVKRALSTNISLKYNINFDAQPETKQESLPNGGLKNDSASDHEEETRKSTIDLNSSLVKKKPSTPAKIVATPKQTKPSENVTKLKIYKCGFCSYQSKELGNVRLHMKIHIRAKTEADGEKSVVSASALTAPKNPVSVRRRVFRCQVCSASFDDRNKCLEHISRDHTAAGRKLGEQKLQDGQVNTKSVDPLADGTNRVAGTEQATGNLENSLESNNQEEMDTSEPPSIGIYNCDACPSTFNNDVDFANHTNEHVKAEGQNESKISEEEKSETDFTQMPTPTDNQGTNDEEAPKDGSMGLDIEAMIAALHSEGPESASDSMPNI